MRCTSLVYDQPRPSGEYGASHQPADLLVDFYTYFLYMVNLGEFDLIRSARRVGRANRYRGAQSAVGRVWYIICIYHYICSSHICPIVLWRGAFTTTFTFRVAGRRPDLCVAQGGRPPTRTGFGAGLRPLAKKYNYRPNHVELD